MLCPYPASHSNENRYKYQLMRLKNTAATTIKPKSTKGTQRLGTSDKLIFN